MIKTTCYKIIFILNQLSSSHIIIRVKKVKTAQLHLGNYRIRVYINAPFIHLYNIPSEHLKYSILIFFINKLEIIINTSMNNFFPGFKTVKLMSNQTKLAVINIIYLIRYFNYFNTIIYKNINGLYKTL